MGESENNKDDGQNASSHIAGDIAVHIVGSHGGIDSANQLK